MNRIFERIGIQRLPLYFAAAGLWIQIVWSATYFLEMHRPIHQLEEGVVPMLAIVAPLFCFGFLIAAINWLFNLHIGSSIGPQGLKFESYWHIVGLAWPALGFIVGTLIKARIQGPHWIHAVLALVLGICMLPMIIASPLLLGYPFVISAPLLGIYFFIKRRKHS